MSSDLLVIAAIGAGLYFLSPGATTAAVDAAAKAAGTIAEAAGSVIDVTRKSVEEVSKAIDNTVEVGIGVPLVFEGCRDGFRNDGLTCFKDGGIRTYECGRLRGALARIGDPNFARRPGRPSRTRKSWCAKRAA